MSFAQMIEDDLDTFFDPDVFGTSAVFSRTGETINVMFDKDQDPETGRIIDVITAKASDVESVAVGDTFTTANDVYRMVSKYPLIEGGKTVAMRVEK
jgi:hypothetical protein